MDRRFLTATCLLAQTLVACQTVGARRAGTRSPEAAGDPGAGATAVPPAAEPETAALDTAHTGAKPKVARARGDDASPPRVTAARLAGDRVRLFFSEPLAPVEGVDPRQFRLSFAVSYSDGDESSGYYYDVGGALDRDDPLTVVSLESNPNDGTELTLKLNQSIPAEICEDIQEAQEEPESQAGLFVHYTRHGRAEVTDRAGNGLQEIGGDWALRQGALAVSVEGKGVVMRTDLLIRVPCKVDRIM